jgi:mono/diheme cytochrome c family protein
MRRVLLLAPLVVLLAAGCVNGTVTTATPSNHVKALPPPAPTVGDPTAGKLVFKGSAGCFGCHTLKDAGATGTVGPNLDEKKPSKALILDRVTNGKGVMPAFGTSGQLNPKQIADVVAYVYQATHS